MTVNNSRCLIVTPMSQRCGFQNYVPQVQISQNRQWERPQDQACSGSWVQQGLGSLPVSEVFPCTYPRCAGGSPGGARCSAPPCAPCQQSSASLGHLRMRGGAGRNTGGEAGWVVSCRLCLRLFLFVLLIFPIFRVLVPFPQQHSNSSRAEHVFFTYTARDVLCDADKPLVFNSHLLT